MKNRILLASAAALLAICFSQGVALAKKEVIIDEKACRANRDAKAKQCALDGNVPVATCVAGKNICYEDIRKKSNSAR